MRQASRSHHRPRPSGCIARSKELERDRIARAGASLRIIPLPHLIVLKLYAGGMKSKADIVELLKRNPDADRGEIRAICRQYRLRGLEPLIREADAAG